MKYEQEKDFRKAANWVLYIPCVRREKELILEIIEGLPF